MIGLMRGPFQRLVAFPVVARPDRRWRSASTVARLSSGADRIRALPDVFADAAVHRANQHLVGIEPIAGRRDPPVRVPPKGVVQSQGRTADEDVPEKKMEGLVPERIEAE